MPAIVRTYKAGGNILGWILRCQQDPQWLARVVSYPSIVRGTMHGAATPCRSPDKASTRIAHCTSDSEPA